MSDTDHFRLDMRLERGQNDDKTHLFFAESSWACSYLEIPIYELCTQHIRSLRGHFKEYFFSWGNVHTLCLNT